MWIVVIFTMMVVPLASAWPGPQELVREEWRVGVNLVGGREGGSGLAFPALCTLFDEGFSQICIAFFRIINFFSLLLEKKQLRLFLWP